MPVTESPSLEARSLTIFSPATTTYLRFNAPSTALISKYDFAVKIARRVMARKMRNIHVAAYVPAEFGVHDIEYSGVSVAVKKAMVIPVCECPVESAVEPMAMPAMPSMCSSPWATIVRLELWKRLVEVGSDFASDSCRCRLW